jgi:hypothetical protein
MEVASNPRPLCALAFDYPSPLAPNLIGYNIVIFLLPHYLSHGVPPTKTPCPRRNLVWIESSVYGGQAKEVGGGLQEKADDRGLGGMASAGWGDGAEHDHRQLTSLMWNQRKFAAVATHGSCAS